MKNLWLFLTLCFCFAGNAFAVISLSGTAFKSGSSDTITIDLTVSGFAQGEYPTNSEVFFSQIIRARLPSYEGNASNFVHLSNYESTPIGSYIPLNTYELTILNVVDNITSADSTTEAFRISLELRDIAGNNFDGVVNSAGDVQIEFRALQEGSSSEFDTQVTELRITATSDNVVVSAIPSGVSASAGDGSLSVNWTAPTSNVAFYNIETKSIESAKSLPSGVTVLLFERGVNDYVLDARLANGDEETEDANGECNYNDGVANGAGCISGCSTDASVSQDIAYLDINAIRAGNDFLSGLIRILEANSSEDSVTFTGLKNDTEYRAVVVYEPNQINLSTTRCVSAIPKEQFSIQGKFAGASKKDTTKVPCMITQVSAGEWVEHELDLFRFVRDRWFFKTEGSLHLVSSYYAVSAIIEKPLEQSGFLRGVLYGVFEPVASLLNWML